jgi:uncharacterized protein DUF4236
MGYFRFRRSIKIAPGVRWNIGKKSSSISVGGRGLTHTIGTKGSRTTIGIPGTGVSYTQVHSHPQAPPPLPATPPSISGPNKPISSKTFYTLGIILLVIWVLTKLSDQNVLTSPAVSSFASPTPVTSPEPDSSRYVAPTNYSTPSYLLNPTSSPIPVRRAVPANPLGDGIRSQSDLSPTASSPTAQITPGYVAPTVEPSPTSTPSIAYHVVNIGPRDFLNIRQGPGSNYPIVARIGPSARGIILGIRRAANGSTVWQEISVAGYSGWVNEIYLQRNETLH